MDLWIHEVLEGDLLEVFAQREMHRALCQDLMESDRREVRWVGEMISLNLESRVSTARAVLENERMRRDRERALLGDQTAARRLHEYERRRAEERPIVERRIARSERRVREIHGAAVLLRRRSQAPCARRIRCPRPRARRRGLRAPRRSVGASRDGPGDPDPDPPGREPPCACVRRRESSRSPHPLGRVWL
jgi:hypothetical protein